MVSGMELCTSAVVRFHVSWPVPDNWLFVCFRCITVDGRVHGEGSFIKLRREQVPLSADVVFVVEAKACNQDMVTHRNMDLFLNILAKELDEAGLKENRFVPIKICIDLADKFFSFHCTIFPVAYLLLELRTFK